MVSARSCAPTARGCDTSKSSVRIRHHALVPDRGRKPSGTDPSARARCSTLEAVSAFDLRDAQLVLAVPALAALLAHDRVLRIAPPRCDCGFTRPVRDGDAQAIRAARAVDTEIARLFARQLRHAV